jgi:hypothetical protein
LRCVQLGSLCGWLTARLDAGAPRDSLPLAPDGLDLGVGAQIDTSLDLAQVMLAETLDLDNLVEYLRCSASVFICRAAVIKLLRNLSL